MRVLGGIALAAASAMALATPSAQIQLPSAPPTIRTAQAYPPQYAQPAYATPAQSGWEQHKARLAALARQQGVREATIQAVIPYLQPNHRVMELDRAQRPTSTSYYVQNFGPYLDRHITASLASLPTRPPNMA